MKKLLEPIIPGEILKEEFMLPHNLNANQLAMRLQVPPGRITGIINGQRAITPETALRLAAFFGTSPQFWLNLQSAYDLQLSSDEFAGRIALEVRPLKF